MPELPEVEVVRRGVERWAAGHRVTAVTVHDPRSLRRDPAGPEGFSRRLTGSRLGVPQRRGKYLWIPLQETSETTAESAAGGEESAVQSAQDAALLIHLGMSGQVLIESRNAPAQKHLKVTVELETDDDAGTPTRQLRFVDQRIFGGMQLSELVPALGPNAHRCGTVPKVAAHIAPDPLEPVVTAERFFRSLRTRRSGLKRALLDQTVISGVGNIYADEALWRARLHYARRTETVTRAEAARLLEALQHVMEQALAAGGTSFDALYVNVNGDSGYFSRSLRAYGQAGRPCPRCAVSDEPRRRERGIIRREKFMNRSSYYCPGCQPRPRHGRW
ncbi:bifunctional DNA-formamidopyrimidine glycosylase/DNA-(apurinic or apyrimidinic site) lyase [Nesterenkonia alba]|uniref:bifunctional DNA-formamidopyrimidine glycosylase/DNA-(apurinic or apyrimidinic site) lyase n=1 Tax=Nesterenkonia alba TaxID=515814 RepID=UPI0003B4CEA4|nr:bifunctional DNA-formamidopyrimidine glycosylase/DNA-(apurinic or apyrimidinic site) lyase [Nesterenkonia alba]